MRDVLSRIPAGAAVALGALGFAALAAALVSTEQPQAGSISIAQNVNASSGATGGSQLAAATPAAAAQLVEGRSQLYPMTWLPVDAGGQPDGSGRYLDDFSYAGYAMGDKPIPASIGGMTINAVTDARFGADNTYGPSNPGAADSTVPIQKAIDFVCNNGGGTVFLPAGGYRIKPQGNATSAIRLPCSRIVLRGEVSSGGSLLTYVVNDEANMHGKRMISAGPSEEQFYLYTVVGTAVPVTEKVTLPTRVIRVTNTASFDVGDFIVIRTDVTPGYRAFHGMGPGQNGCPSNGEGCWPTNEARGEFLYRQIKAIDRATNRISLDIPTRYILDPGTGGNNARVHKTLATTYNVGIESLNLAMREADAPGLGDDQYAEAGTGAYQMAGSALIKFVAVKDGWVKNVRTFRPSINTRDVHIASNGIVINGVTRGITVQDCVIAKPAYLGAGGNGYLYLVSGGENLIQDSVAIAGRHNFLLTGMGTAGNVILRGESIDGRLYSDTHTYLTRANLVDGLKMTRNAWSVANRYTSSFNAGHTATQMVFWNLIKNDTSSAPLIISAQFKWGYIIGTRGATATVSAPASGFFGGAVSAEGTCTQVAGGGCVGDYVEALNDGASLSPVSLYLDQKAKRAASANY